MSTITGPNYSENDNTCVVCFKNADIFSVGMCDHPVCYECSTRMRVLCRQNECPICRTHMAKVVFTNKILPWGRLRTDMPASLFDSTFGICFQNYDIKNAYYELLEHNCSICKGRNVPFKTFAQLEDHMRRKHDLLYCDLCVKNLRIFSWERKCYTRGELGLHRRKGDPDNTSHRGHPLCEFCDVRYMDSDELFRHLRRDHLYCHFCDADGLHQYYPNYNSLRQHFLTEHYLCEEGDCANDEFTAVFRTEIDLKAHKASVHGRTMSKAASKQARTLEFEFRLAPRPRPEPNRGPRNKYSTGPSTSQNANSLDDDGAAGYDTFVVDAPAPNTMSNVDFPTLGGAAAPPIPKHLGGGVTIRHITGGRQQGLARTNENFPALSDTGGGTVRLSVNSSSSQDRPQSSKPNVSIHVNHRPNGAITTRISQNSNSVQVRPKTAEAFPALSSVAVPEAQWVRSNKKPERPALTELKPKQKSAPLPSDFPSLESRNSVPATSASAESDNKTKKSSVTVPVTNSWASESEQKELKSKGKKKKSKNTSSNNSSGNESGSFKPVPVDNGAPSALETKTKDLKSKREPQIVKKRSELKIDSLQNGLEDFPPLGTTKPPPGFSVPPPPPGFAPMNTPPISNSLTFTTSSGQSYSILPPKQYFPPPNFTQRNQNLMEKFTGALKSNEAILEFKRVSNMFKNGEYSAAGYYSECREILGKDFSKIFPELLALLPDIDKQQELFAYHEDNNGSKRGLEVCAVCNQVVTASDLRNHLGNHNLENHFPVLNMQNVGKK